VTDVQLPPALTIWGDFNCPWCALVSVRTEEPASSGRAEIDWRAVQHRPDLPPEGGPPDEELEAAFDDVMTAATPAERMLLRLPSRVPNTAQPTLRLAGLDRWARASARSRLFEALWRDDLDIGSPTVLDMINLPDGVHPPEPGGDSRAVAQRWQGEWQQLGGRVPLLRAGDGTLHAGGPACVALMGGIP